MSKAHDRTFTGDFRRFFLRGLVVLLPTVLTLWIVVKAYQFVDNTIAEPINRGIRLTLGQAVNRWEPLRAAFEPTEAAVVAQITELQANDEKVPERAELRARLRTANINKWWQDQWPPGSGSYLDLIGLIVAIIAVYIAGRLLGGLIGRRIYRRLEQLATSLPIFKQVYPYVKQVVEFLFSDDGPIKFNRVVAVEYPRKGVWSVGFMTGESLRSLQKHAGRSVTIFIPSSPTPFTGYTITVPAEDVIEMPISVEEAIRFSVSGGVLIPDHQVGEGRADGPLGKTGLVPIPKLGEMPATEGPQEENPPASRNAG
jgi:uncharacterized membrane protein